MSRGSKMSVTRAVTVLLLGTCLAVTYLYKDSIDPKLLPLHHALRKDSSQKTKPPTNTTTTTTTHTCMPDLSAVNISGFSSFSSEIQDFLYYRHCRHFPMLLDLPDKCSGDLESADHIFLLLVIKSSPENYDRREVLRKTWAKERVYHGARILRIFISGTKDTGFEKDRLNRLLELEQREYKDILQWDFNESFFNLTLKQILFLEWMERNCLNTRFLLNGDDDVFANTDNMVEYLQSLNDNDGSKHLLTGYLIENSSPVRWASSKYYVPQPVYEPNSYPPYCGGGGFLLSAYTAMVIYRQSQSIPIIPIDDAYIGMCLARANLVPYSHIGVKTLGWYIPSSKLDKYDPCYFKDMLLVHRFLPANLYVMWQRIYDPNLKCVTSKKWIEENQMITYSW